MYLRFVYTIVVSKYALRAPYRGPVKFYMSISNRLITIIRGDNLKSISFLYRMYKSHEICEKTRNMVLKIFFGSHVSHLVFLVIRSIYEAFHVNPPSAKFLARV